jgi:hypothetical protein
MASLIAVIKRMTIKGTEPNAGFDAPKMGKTYVKIDQSLSTIICLEEAYSKNSDEKEVDVGDIVELKP